MPKILFLVAHRPNRSPSQRFRFEQYLDFLQNEGFEYKFSYLLSAWDDKYFYSKGNFLLKAFIVLKSIFKRFNDIRVASNYDVAFVQREAFMLGTTFFERQIGKRTKLIFDFDDSIWKMDVSKGNERLKWLKNPNKTKELISISDLVFAGNDYLKEFALQFNQNVVIIPTTIDTEEYRPNKKPKDKICIGWSGSKTTIKHFETALPFLKQLKQKYGDNIYIKVIGDHYSDAELSISGSPWKKDTELEDLNEFDIGIMPLPDDEWTKGKCGLKGLQYMALEIPTIMSPVGVNSEIIEDGKNGFLADKENEWAEKVSLLIESSEIRKEIGKAGRETVMERYSVHSKKENYLKYLLNIGE